MVSRTVKPWEPSRNRSHRIAATYAVQSGNEAARRPHSWAFRIEQIRIALLARILTLEASLADAAAATPAAGGPANGEPEQGCGDHPSADLSCDVDHGFLFLPFEKCLEFDAAVPGEVFGAGVCDQRTGLPVADHYKTIRRLTAGYQERQNGFGTTPGQI